MGGIRGYCGEVERILADLAFPKGLQQICEECGWKRRACTTVHGFRLEVIERARPSQGNLS